MGKWEWGSGKEEKGIWNAVDNNRKPVENWKHIIRQAEKYKMKMDDSLNLILPNFEFRKLPTSAFTLPHSFICTPSAVRCHLFSDIERSAK